MSKRRNRNSFIESKNRKLRCPVCQQPICATVDQRHFKNGMAFSLSSQPGDLTQCDQCLTLLEYQGEPTSLTLHVAPRKRADAFNKLCREGYRKPTLPELIDYVKGYRQMPRESSDVFRKQQSIPFEIGDEK